MKIKDELNKIVSFESSNPFLVLGPKLSDKTLTITSYLPFALDAWIKPKKKHREKLDLKEKIQMKRVTPQNIYQAEFENVKEIFPYVILYEDQNGITHEIKDPYAYPLQITDYDLYLIGEGNHFKIYEKLGAKIKKVNKTMGVHFAVWAPHAKAVSVIGDFNNWEEGAHPMENLNNQGVWSLFIPEIYEGEKYKYAIKTKKNEIKIKSDPFAFQAEVRPQTASVVSSLKEYKWKDNDWMKIRAKSDFKRKPMSIYEVHLGSWKRNLNEESEYPKNEWGFLNYRQLAHELVDYTKEMGFTHLELLPIMEHPLDTSWGYQVVNYFAPTSRFGTPEDFMYFVDYCHNNNIGVILDWVPAHFPVDDHGLNDFDGEQIYAYQNPKKAFHKDWGTLIFDYGKNEVVNFLVSNALFWFSKYHIDGLRVDAVASMLYLDYSRNDGEWEPNIHGGNENLEAVEFIKKLNKCVHKYNKGVVMIAEESTNWQGVTKPVHLGGLSFDMKWNMGWMHDVLKYFSTDPIYRKFNHNHITFSLWYSFNENYLLPISHDEVVHGKRSLIDKMPGDQWQKFANLRLFFGFMYGHPGKKLNFMGNDFAQFREWNCEWQLDWELFENDYNKKLNLYFKDLQKLYLAHKEFWEIDFESRGFNWIDFSDAEQSVLSFIRYSNDKKDFLVFTCNMTPVLRENYLIGVPKAGFYKEIFNSDAEIYGGSGKGNLGGVDSFKEKRFHYDNTLKLTLPPLAINIFKWEKQTAQLEQLKERAELSDDIINDAESIVSDKTFEHEQSPDNIVNEI